MKTYHFFKFFVVAVMIGLFSPSLTMEKIHTTGAEELSFSLLTKAEARRGGRGMRGGGMRRGGMSSPRGNRYQGGNFSRSRNSL